MLAAEKEIKEESSIPYRILYHRKGYIRIEVLSLTSFSWSLLFMNLKKSPPFPLPAGITDFHVNPLKGSIVIIYEPDDIDILKYIKKMASDPEIRKILKG